MTTRVQILGTLMVGPHKNYYGRVWYEDEADLFHGEVMDLRDVITFQGKSIAQVQTAFVESVDDYLAFCEVRGEEPEKPYSGKFVARVPPQLHKAIANLASLRGISLNEFVTDALDSAAKSVSRTGRGVATRNQAVSTRKRAAKKK